MGRKALLTGLSVLLLLFTGAAQGQLPRWHIGPAGGVGPLRLDASTAGDIMAAMGPPDLPATGSFAAGGRYEKYFRALGYDCAPGANVKQIPIDTSRSGPYCRIIFYINARTQRLVAVAARSSRFVGPAGLYSGEPASQAERRLGVKAIDGCFQGFYLGTRRTHARLFAWVNGGRITRPGGPIDGGRIGVLWLESNRHPVGLLFC